LDTLGDMTETALIQRLQAQCEQLRAAPDTAPDLGAAFGRCAYTWLQISAHWMEQADERRALQAWFQVSRCLPEHWDDGALRVVGLADADAFRARSGDMSARRAAKLKGSLQALREMHGPAPIFRIDRALAGYLGQARVFSSHATQQPKVIYVPGLSTAGFVQAQSISLARALSQAYEGILEEFERALREHDPHEPFMGRLSKDVERQYVSGGQQASWDAIFFDRHGQRHDEVHRRYPVTSQVLEQADRCRIPQQSPETCFSILQPRTKIEPHHGVTNARLVVHLPLRVPQGCYLELVGVGRHHWREGEVFAFDDTFLHAAENPSDEVRGILLTDAWHPELTAVEREAFTMLITTLTDLESPPLARPAT
jgi:aspartate beta-hydroxylase